jgi:hypothetical protein
MASTLTITPSRDGFFIIIPDEFGELPLLILNVSLNYLLLSLLSLYSKW